MGTRSRGFTLIELLVVIAIIGLLSSIVLASLKDARLKAYDAQRLSDMHAVMVALEMYANDNGGLYPLDPAYDCNNGGPCNCAGDGPSLNNSSSGDDCLDDFVSNPANAPVLAPKYIAKLPADPEYANTINNYQYCTSDSGVTYGLIMRSDLLVPSSAYKPGYPGWCRPQVPFVLNPACPYDNFPHCTPPYWP